MFCYSYAPKLLTDSCNFKILTNRKKKKVITKKLDRAI